MIKKHVTQVILNSVGSDDSARASLCGRSTRRKPTWSSRWWPVLPTYYAGDRTPIALV